MNRIKTKTFKNPDDMDEFVNKYQEHFSVFATQTHVGFGVNGEPQSYVAVVFYRDGDK